MPSDQPSWHPIDPQAGTPAPAGAYSPAVRAGDFLFVSGQIPRDPATGAIVGDDVAAQTRQVMHNLGAALAGGGATLRDVVSLTVYLADPEDWGVFNAAYRDIMTPPYPTRTAVGAVLRGILIEISAVAFIPGR